VQSYVLELFFNCKSSGGPGDESEELANTAKEILGHYERTNKAGGRAREAVFKLVRIRDARVAKESGFPDRALEVGPVSFILQM
jgi:nuclear pore complex protein Nup93